MRVALLLLLAAAPGCLDFAALGTPLDAAVDARFDAAPPPPDLEICSGPTGGKEECTKPSECRLGYTCVSSANGPGLCLLICSSNADCGCPGSICIIDSGGNFCSRSCDLTGQTGCPASSSCDYFIVGDLGFTSCRQLGPSTAGQPCNLLNDCVLGTTCVGTCAPWCNNMVTCPPNQTCMTLVPPVTIHGIEYGVCQ